MSNFFIVSMLLTLNVSATVLGQRVSITMTDATLEDCIKSIERQTELGFFYKARQVKKINGIEISMQNAMVTDVLEKILEGTDLCYEIDNDVILLKNRPLNKALKTPVIAERESEIQKLVVRGTIKDNSGQVMPGAAIIEKGTANGVLSDADGNYSIEVAGQNSILEFSFLGYQTQELAVGTRTVIDVTLILSVNELDEAVVIGYGTSKKKDLTGSVVRVSVKAIESSSFTDMGQILQGQVAGMEVVSGSGRPGDQVRIRIRGESSLQGDASPLIVIDEVPMPDNYDLNLINPNDIQNIDILKGASAAAIYGSKGSAGVVLITTKQGKEGTAEVFYNGNISFQQYSNKIQGLNAEQYKTLLLRESIYDWIGKSVWYVENYNRNPYYYGDMRQYGYFHRVFDPTYFEDSDTDWSKVLTQNPVNNNHTLGIRGGNKEASYYASFGYTDNQGIIINNYSKRLSINLNLDIRPTKWFEMGFRINGANNPVSNTGDYSLIWQQRPDIPVYNEDGSYYRYYSTGHSRYRDNALQLAEHAPSLSDNLNYTLSGYGRIVFSENLRYQATYSYSESRGASSRYTPSYTYTGSGGYYGGVSGIRNSTNSYSNQLNFDNALHYAFTNENHDVSAMIGTTFNQDKAGSISTQFQDFPDDFIQNVEYNATKWNGSSGSDDASAYFSVYGRVNYKLMDRYLFTGTLRRDASSKFSPAYRAGLFPAAAAAWVLSEEDFLKYNPIQLSFLKIRLGYGVTGDNRIGRYAWRAQFGSTNYFDKPGTIPSTIGNDQVRWEETTQLDAAIEFGFFKNRIFGTLGVYTKNTDGLLFGYSLAPSAGLTSINMNFAEVENKGIEFDIRGQVIESADWSLMLGFNIASNKGMVLGLDKDVVGDAYGSDPGSYTTTVIAEGQPLGLIYGYRVAGVVRSTEEMMEIRNSLTGQYPYFGSYHYVDLNEDGSITTTYDREVLGSSVPDFFGGFNVDFRYKNLTARLVGKYSVGAQKHWTGLDDQFHANLYNPNNVLEYALYAWTPDNPNSRFQAFGAGWEKFIGDNYVFDASFLKLSDINIGYDLPAKWTERIGLSNVNIYAAVNNIYTFTTYPGTNVEAYSSGIGGAGQDYSVYPLTRTFSLGIKAMLR